MRHRLISCFTLLAALALFAGSASAQTISEDTPPGTQVFGMHTCPSGFALFGYDGSNNILECIATGDASPSSVDTGTQATVTYADGSQHQLHACPAGQYIRGIQLSRNLLDCVQAAAIRLLPGTQFVDEDSQFPETANPGRTLHVCHSAQSAFVLMIGLHDGDNKLFCQQFQFVSGQPTPVPTASAYFEDDGTQANGMHTCPAGSGMLGYDDLAGTNSFLCEHTGDGSASFVDSDTQRVVIYPSDHSTHSLHACPAGSYMRGLHVSKNLLTCVNAAAIQLLPGTEFVDEGGAQSQLQLPNSPVHQIAHACRSYTVAQAVMIGVHNSDRRLLCQGYRIAAPAPLPMLPFDLVAYTGLDDNGFMLDPYWHAQSSRVEPAPDSMAYCHGFNGVPPSYGCTSQITALDGYGDGLNTTGTGSGVWLCDSPNGPGGHVNWFPATFQGVIDHSVYAGDLSLDHDDSIFIVPQREIIHDSAGAFSFNPMVTDGNDRAGSIDHAIEVEFDATETTDWFTLPFWQHFNEDTSDPSLHNQKVIVLGLAGLDTVHSGRSELHPAYVVAIQEPGSVPQGDTWAFFVRNWGNEGSCAGRDWRLDGINRLSFRLHSPVSGAPHQAVIRSRGSQGVSLTATPVQTQRGWDELLTVTLPNTASRAILEGEITVEWTNQHGSAPLHRTPHARLRTKAPPPPAYRRFNVTEDPEERFSAVLSWLSPQQFARYRVDLERAGTPASCRPAPLQTLPLVTARTRRRDGSAPDRRYLHPHAVPSACQSDRRRQQHHALDDALGNGSIAVLARASGNGFRVPPSRATTSAGVLQTWAQSALHLDQRHAQIFSASLQSRLAGQTNAQAARTFLETMLGF